MDRTQFLSQVAIRNGNTLICPINQSYEFIVAELGKKMPRPLFITGLYRPDDDYRAIRVTSVNGILSFPTYIRRKWKEQVKVEEDRNEAGTLIREHYEDVPMEEVKRPFDAETIQGLLCQYPEATAADLEKARKALIVGYAKSDLADIEQKISATPRGQSVTDLENRKTELESIIKEG